MEDATDFEPGTIMHNSLLDCSELMLLRKRCQRLASDQVILLYQYLREFDVDPFAHLESSVKACEDISLKYGFLFNVHVYTTILRIWVDQHGWANAISAFIGVFRDRVRRDTRTYSVA